MVKITATCAMFIKLGEGGAWDDLCIKKEKDTLRLAFYEAPHELALAQDKSGLASVFRKSGRSAGTATRFTNQIIEFYTAGPETIWITFADGYLWWCQTDSEVTYLGDDPKQYPNGSRYRRSLDGWSNESIRGEPLLMSELSGALTKTARYRGTICSVYEPEFSYLLGRINGVESPEVKSALLARKEILTCIERLVKKLTWEDFELLVELIFTQSGWQRVGRTGGTQKTVDLELEQLLTKDRAFVQVKSATNQKQLDDYVEQFSRRGECRMFYVYHTSKAVISTDVDGVEVIGPERLSEMILNAGLFDWLVEKVS